MNREFQQSSVRSTRSTHCVVSNLVAPSSRSTPPRVRSTSVAGTSRGSDRTSRFGKTPHSTTRSPRRWKTEYARLQPFGQTFIDVGGACLGNPNFAITTCNWTRLIARRRLSRRLSRSYPQIASNACPRPEIRGRILCVPIVSGWRGFWPVPHRLELDDYARLFAR